MSMRRSATVKLLGGETGGSIMLFEETLPAGREQAVVEAPEGSCLLLLGGEPLGEPLLMWWNFVARTPEEIATATASWRAGEFGQVGGYDGEPMPAPPLDAARLRRPRS